MFVYMMNKKQLQLFHPSPPLSIHPSIYLSIYLSSSSVMTAAINMIDLSLSTMTAEAPMVGVNVARIVGIFLF